MQPFANPARLTTPENTTDNPGSISIRLYRSDWHPCSYIDGRNARTLFVDPSLQKDSHLYGVLQESGFRRSGDEIYRPDCGPCKDCIPARLSPRRFAPRRRHRRLIRSNADRFSLSWEGAQLTEEYFDLYRRYIDSRHADGDMANPTQEDFRRFLIGSWSDTRFLCLRHHGELVAVAVTDFTPIGASAVYTFFAPDYEQYSLGTYCLLQQIEQARRKSLHWLYLGFWVPGCRKMAYKADYRPIQLLLNGEWKEYVPGDQAPDSGSAFD